MMMMMITKGLLEWCWVHKRDALMIMAHIPNCTQWVGVSLTLLLRSSSFPSSQLEEKLFLCQSPNYYDYYCRRSSVPHRPPGGGNVCMRDPSPTRRKECRRMLGHYMKSVHSFELELSPSSTNSSSHTSSTPSLTATFFEEIQNLELLFSTAILEEEQSNGVRYGCGSPPS